MFWSLPLQLLVTRKQRENVAVISSEFCWIRPFRHCCWDTIRSILIHCTIVSYECFWWCEWHVGFLLWDYFICKYSKPPPWITSKILPAICKKNKATPNKFPDSRPLLKYICMWAGGPLPLFHFYFKWIRSHLMQPFECYLSPPILQSSLSRVF